MVNIKYERFNGITLDKTESVNTHSLYIVVNHWMNELYTRECRLDIIRNQQINKTTYEYERIYKLTKW